VSDDADPHDALESQDEFPRRRSGKPEEWPRAQSTEKEPEVEGLTEGDSGLLLLLVMVEAKNFGVGVVDVESCSFQSVGPRKE
jgi:hypothetical protein